MSSEKTTNNATGSGDQAVAPNGHKNGVPAANPRVGSAEGTATSVKKRKKKKKPTASAKAAAQASAQETAEVPTETEVPQETAPHPTEAMQEPPQSTPDAPQEPATVEPDAIATQAAPTEAAPGTATEPVEVAPEPPEPAPEPAPEPEGLKLRMKIWTDPATAKRYLMPTAFMRDVINGQPVSDVMYAYAMSDEDTKLVTLRAHEWNTLPFFYFQEIGPAPRASERPFDAVPAGPGRRPS